MLTVFLVLISFGIFVLGCIACLFNFVLGLLFFFVSGVFFVGACVVGALTGIESQMRWQSERQYKTPPPLPASAYQQTARKEATK